MKNAYQVVDVTQALVDDLGYSFRFNILSDTVEVAIAGQWQPINDMLAAEIRARMREKGFNNAAAVEDVIKLEAGRTRFHPVRSFLVAAGLQYDGGDHIRRLALYFDEVTQPNRLLGLLLRKWLIGAVARAHEETQNFLLVLQGDQNLGKDHFWQWLYAPMARICVEAPVCPDSKDDLYNLATRWIWLVSELGSTTRRQDVEALKAFITRRVVTVRKPYDRHSIEKPALASFAGSVNDAGGFLSDSTGNRRFRIASIKAIDWHYTEDIDPAQVWAEAVNAYRQGEGWHLTPDEALLADANNADAMVSDPTEAMLLKLFYVDPTTTYWTSTADIVQTLERNGLRTPSSRATAMAVAQVLAAFKVSKRRRLINGQQQMGYEGVWPIP